MKKIILFRILVFMFFCNSTVAQNIDLKDDSKNLLFVEAAGFGGYGSINYERLLKNIDSAKLSLRIGLSTYNLKDYSNKFNPDIIIPVAINCYYGAKHNIDFSLGETYTNIVYADNSSFQPVRNFSFHTNLSLGYRYQKEAGGSMLKIAYVAMFEKNKTFRHWVALALGYAF